MGYAYGGPWDDGWGEDDWGDAGYGYGDSGDGDDGGYADSDVAAQGYGEQGYGEQTSPYDYDSAAGGSGGAEPEAASGGPEVTSAAPVVRAQSGAASTGLYDTSAVTLVFKDGRAPERIHNYALTRTMLYVTDGHRQEIPVAALDLAATERVNREAGVSFQLPVGQ